MGKREGAGRKPLKKTLGEDVIELTIRITVSQNKHLEKQKESKAAYIRRLIQADMEA